MFLIDMLLMLITSFLDHRRGREVLDSNEIIPNYLLSLRFVVDFLSVSADFIKIKLLSFVKMVRVMRINEVISRTILPIKTKAALRLGKLLFYLGLYLHVLGCLWFAICSVNANSEDATGFNLTWIPPFHYVNYADNNLFDVDQDTIYQYTVAVYYAILMIGTNEMGPVSPEEIFFCTVALLASSLVYNLIFSEIMKIIKIFSSR
mmetsp:Transcript_42068/g.64479  ORF Transcript_42068/g.64479 Transcript_42068/m.64479 type:complete len:205 (+) Transcript_42068:1109-1723(+)